MKMYARMLENVEPALSTFCSLCNLYYSLLPRTIILAVSFIHYRVTAMCFNKTNSLLYCEYCAVSRAGKIATVNAELSYKMMPRLKF